MVSFLRFDTEGSPIAIVLNFSGVTHQDYMVGLPTAGVWDEILNTDAAEFGGSGVGNLGSVEAKDSPWAGRAASASITLPPLGALYLKLRDR